MRMLFPCLVLLSASTLHAADSYCANGSTPLPDGIESVTRTVVVPAGPGGNGSLVIAGVRVTVAVTHPWVGDLRVVLRHPSGIEVVLLDRPGVSGAGGSGLGFPGPWGCGGDDIDVTFDDAAVLEAQAACETSGTAVVGSKRPLQPLSVLNGLAPAGTWAVIASDLIPIDAGTLGNVCIELTTVTSQACSGDLDGNGSVDGADLTILLGAWGSSCSGCATDLSGDGTIDAADLSILLGAWGQCGA